MSYEKGLVSFPGVEQKYLFPHTCSYNHINNCTMALPLVRAPKSQLTAEQSLTGRHWNSPKLYPTSKDKGEAAMRR